MWILKPLDTGGEPHYLLPGREYVVGRKSCDILLPNDQSISRAHGQLSATEQALTLKDSSKYGTFVNGQRLSENETKNLQAGDNVTFGVFQSKFRVDCEKIVVCSSCLDNDGKASLSQALLPLGGKLVNNWTQDCTHLVMPSVKVTIKTICALLCCRPIVKPEFFTELSRALQQKLPLPKADSFIPVIDEPSLNREEVDLGAIPARKRLFAGKTFLFLSAKQLKRLSAAVSFGGGRSQLLEEGSQPQGLLQSPQSCVVDIATGNTQTLLPSSTTEWANSVKKIVQEKGLRLITESEIGLAAIYASCDKHCNPSSLVTDTESVQKMKPRIPSATLSQNATVDETVLPAASQNITAYVVNTETSQRMETQSEVMGVTTVGETPEKSQNRNTSQLGQPKSLVQEMDTTSSVTDTVRLSVSAVEKTGSEWKKPESKIQGGRNTYASSKPSRPEVNGGMRTFPQRQSPQKPKVPAQASPQKQSTLTSFFQPVNKKRPLEDELSADMSEPKRTVPASFTDRYSSTSSPTSKQKPSHSDTFPAATAQTQLGSGADLFARQSETLSNKESHLAQQGPQGRKRKEMEAEIRMEELESIMSMDMDYLDDQTSDDQGWQTQPAERGSAKQKQALDAVETPSTSKRQRVDLEENGKAKQKPYRGMEKPSVSNINQSLEVEEDLSSIKRQHLHPSEKRPTNQMPEPPEAELQADGSPWSQHVKDEEMSALVDPEPLNGDLCQNKREQETPLKPTTVKQEYPVSETDEDLPKKLVLVEFKSLTVTAAPTAKPQQRQGNSYSKNFKCFRKVPVPGAGASPHIIGASDLLVHNRGKNSELDEWLRDAAEEERQIRHEESIGDDLFRYQPTKLTKRR
ncbi:nibrin [Myripristis murdjan]|uniref:Nibrin n=1 Tax=Myripristis murdjan TaxID=586833 RepID=A0A667ZAI1_9TELE|nr:nibrin [Myripristis murdjan]